MNIWAASAIGFLILGIYLPFLNKNLNLIEINFVQFLLTALVMIVIVGLLELRKFFSLNKNLKSINVENKV